MNEHDLNAAGTITARTLPSRIRHGISWRAAGIHARMRDVFPPFLPIVRELSDVTGRSFGAVAADVADTWISRGWQPPLYAALMLWEIEKNRRDDFLTSKELDPFLVRLLHPDDQAFGRDKCECAEHARAHGVPWVPTLAVVNRRQGASAADSIIIDRPDDLWPMLERLATRGDVALKPANGMQGRGFFAVLGTGGILDGDGHPVSRGEMVRHVFEYNRNDTAYGYLVQPLLKAHPAMAELTGVETLATVRVVTVRHASGDFTLQSFLKIPAPGRLVDNFRRGVSGTFIAAADPSDGRLNDLLGLVHPGRRHVIERTGIHPHSGKRIAGRELPAWRECLDVAFRAAASRPKSPIFAWDIGLGPEGWMVLEANPLGWGPVGGQASTRRGLRPVLARLYPDDWD